MTAAESRRQNLLAEIIERSQAELLQTIRWLVPTLEDAEDILQDVLYRLAISFDDIRSLEQISGWLYTVARNRVTDWYRSRSSSPRARELQMATGEPYLLEELLPDVSDNPELRFMRREMGEAIDEALAALPPRQRDVFIWHEIEGFSFAQIAERTGLPINTLLSQKRYAVQGLRSQLNGLRFLKP